MGPATSTDNGLKTDSAGVPNRTADMVTRLAANPGPSVADQRDAPPRGAPQTRLCWAEGPLPYSQDPEHPRGARGTSGQRHGIEKGWGQHITRKWRGNDVLGQGPQGKMGKDGYSKFLRAKGFLTVSSF